MFEDRPLHVQLKAAMVEEKEGKRLIVGLTDIDAQVRQEKELGRLLAQAQTEANIDALTGIKNRHAYLTAEARLNQQIEEHTQAPFAIVMLDVNDLKKVNDTAGHQAGDQYLKDACKIVCNTFKRSPVFRVGGDEFAVIARGDDYARIEELIEMMNDYNAEAARTGGIVIACGMAKYDNDASVAPVLKRADHNMYENKSKLKGKL
jgi:diguanylate cyclase (GGDEF)-like protein